MDGPLHGFRIVELAFWAAGPAATCVLADWGAEVIKIEPPDGDPIRALTTGAMMDDDIPADPMLQLLNHNKRSITLDLNRAAARNMLIRLIERSDVFVTNLRLPALSRLGLDYPTIAKTNQRIIYASFTAYGHLGAECSRVGFDYGAAWARTGLMAMIGEPGTAPPAPRPAMVDLPSGLALAGAISAALLRRERTGGGCHVLTSLLEMGLWMNAVDLTIAISGRSRPQPESRSCRPNPLVNSYRCKDGHWVYLLLVQSERHWASLCKALGHPEWITDQRFLTGDLRHRNNRELTGLLDKLFATNTLSEWARRLDAHNLVWSAVQSIEEVLGDPQVRAMNMFQDVNQPSGEKRRIIRSPVNFDMVRTEPLNSAPELGQHTEEIALELGYSWEDIAYLREARAFG